MAQLFANTPFVTSTFGFDRQNKPVTPISVVRFFCDAEILIDGLDHNKYPAIRFDLDNRAVQYWAYPTKNLRDADCEILEDAIGPPSSLYTAFWDITGNALPDLNPTAINIGGISGTMEADQLYFDLDGTSPMPVPFDGLIEVRGIGGNPFNIANFDAANGTPLALIASWSGPFALQVATNMLGTVGHTLLLQFSKLTFASIMGLLYSKALTLRFKIKARKSGDLSGNTGNLLNLPIVQNIGTFNRLTDIDIRDGIIYASMFGGFAGVNQGLTSVKISEKWSKKNYNAEVSDIGTYARTFADTDSPSGVSLIVLIAVGVGSAIYRSQVTSFDVDGMPVFAAAVAIGGGGAGLAGAQRYIMNEFLQSGGMPVVMYCRFNAFPVEIVANTGTPSTPNYTLNLSLNSIDASLINSYDGETASDGRTYLTHGNSGGNFRATMISRLTYSGPSTAVGYTTGGNWASERIGTSVGTGAASSGTGATFEGTLNGFALDESNIVNGEPTMYASDEQSEVIFRIRRNLSSFGDERDWDFLIVAGTGASGNVNGVGTAASFTDIRYLKVDGKFLYINTSFGGYGIRRMEKTSLIVETFMGVLGTPGVNPQFSY